MGMEKIDILELISAIQDGNFLWIIIPIFFIGIITDKYQEEYKTSIGNAISNGALIIFTGFSWLQIIFSRADLPENFIISQIIFSLMIIFYGLIIIGSGFHTGKFAKIYGRIRVITFMLIFFTIMIYVPILYNFISILIFVLLFPFYYAFITELIKIMPKAISKKTNQINIEEFKFTEEKTIFTIGKEKIKEYLK